jgi:hypothetical protein
MGYLAGSVHSMRRLQGRACFRDVAEPEEDRNGVFGGEGLQRRGALSDAIAAFLTV